MHHLEVRLPFPLAGVMINTPSGEHQSRSAALWLSLSPHTKAMQMQELQNRSAAMQRRLSSKLMVTKVALQEHQSRSVAL
jgi:hypothetical protein